MEEENTGSSATSLAPSPAAAACADATASSAAPAQHSVWKSVPAAMDAAAGSGAASSVNQPAFRSFETESPGVLVGAGVGANAVDWRQEWNSL